MHPKIKHLIAHYGLTALPVEGTLFTSTYRSAQNAPDGGPVGTAMIGLYAHEPRSFSSFHRLPSDEIWHFYDGDPLRLVLLYPDGSSQDVLLGRDVSAGQRVQFVVPAGVWQAGHVLDSGVYALFGCTMAPGFTSAGFEGAETAALLQAYPDRTGDILRLASPDAETRMPDGFAT
jgi:predicted cupin superfamily sugar epimerase